MNPIKEILSYLKILDANELRILEEIIFERRYKIEKELKEKMLQGIY